MAEELINVMQGAGMASKPEEFLKAFDETMRSKEDEDSFSTLQKFSSNSFVALRPSRTGNEKYNAPEGIDGTKAKSVNQEYSAYGLFELAEPPYNLVKLVRIAESSTPHYAAVAAKVSNTTQLGYDFIESAKVQDRISDKKGQDKTKAQKSLSRAKRRLHDWVDNLNSEDDLDETLTKVAIDYYYTGNAYIEVGRTALGEIGMVTHVPATTVRVRKARDGYVQIVGDKATFFRNFGDESTKDPINSDSRPNEIIHFKNYSPLSGYYGVPEIVVALTAVAGSELASRYNLDYFHNKATPRYVIVMKGGNLSATGSKQLMEFFETGIKGTNHRSLYVPLPADTADAKTSFEMKPVEAGVQEASFEKYIKMNTNTVLMAHRVPVSKVGLAEGVSLAVARDADKTFKEQVTRPMQSRLEKKINKIIHTYTDMFDFKFNELSLSDEDTQSKIDERYLRNKVHTPNEVRASRGYAGIEGGDKVIDLSARQAADASANTRQTRARDAERSASAKDKEGEGRNEAGAGAESE